MARLNDRGDILGEGGKTITFHTVLNEHNRKGATHRSALSQLHVALGKAYYINKKAHDCHVQPTITISLNGVQNSDGYKAFSRP